MDKAYRQHIESATGFEICKIAPVSGGCINEAWRVETTSGEVFFVKTNERGSDMFATEVDGLSAMAGSKTVRVPEVIGFQSGEGQANFLMLQWIEAGRKAESAQRKLGRQLALLHKHSVGDQFGFLTDNFLGETLQPNARHDDWAKFWAVNRLEHQLKLAQDNGVGTPELQTLGQSLIGKLDEIISGSSEPPALIHGDLWSGNWMVDAAGEPVLIDPAVYWADREAEFGMMTLFGDFSSDFYAAYDEIYPLLLGWQDRVTIYRLYHVLNHLNLFGGSYLGGCLDILRRFK